MDNACREYLFVVDFFNLTPTTAQDFFDSIFGKTLAYLLVGAKAFNPLPTSQVSHQLIRIYMEVLILGIIHILCYMVSASCSFFYGW